MMKTSDEEYFKKLDRIVKGAEYIGNPLIKDEDKEKALKLYDELCAEALKIRSGEKQTNDN